MNHYSHRGKQLGKQRGKQLGKQRVAALLVGAGSAAGLVLAVPGAASAAPSPSVSCTPNVATVTCTYAYSYTGSAQTFTPLPGVTSVFVALTGGSGGTGGTYSGGGAGGAGGKGAAVTGSLSLTGLTGLLTVDVGGQGQPGGYDTATDTGGFGYGSGGQGGGRLSQLWASGGGGGGGSAVLSSTGTALAVAGGGGGGGGGASISNGTGGPGGAASTNGTAGSTGGAGGTAGGQAPAPGGGAGQFAYGNGGGGGGGGGGLAGGNGGGNSNIGFTGGGGGGGTSLLAGGSVTNSANTGDGQVKITFTVPKPSITTTSLPNATGGHFYTTTLAAAGGIPPYAWSVVAGSLPPGLGLNATTGVISGVPHVTGTYFFKIGVADSEPTPQTAAKWFAITVSGPVVTGVRPHSGPAYGDTPVRITGYGLACPRFDRFCRVSVTFGGHPARVFFASPNLILAVSPPGSGTVDVIVTVRGVHSQAHPADHFTYRFPFI